MRFLLKLLVSLVNLLIDSRMVRFGSRQTISRTTPPSRIAPKPSQAFRRIQLDRAKAVAESGGDTHIRGRLSSRRKGGLSHEIQKSCPAVRNTSDEPVDLIHAPVDSVDESGDFVDESVDRFYESGDLIHEFVDPVHESVDLVYESVERSDEFVDLFTESPAAPL
jgi:hypothetical protein